VNTSSKTFGTSLDYNLLEVDAVSAIHLRRSVQLTFESTVCDNYEGGNVRTWHGVYSCLATTLWTHNLLKVC